MQKLVYATTNAVLAHAGRRVPIRAGEIWAGDDPVVAHYPSMFTGQPRAVRTTRRKEGWMRLEQPVEQTTAAPGEQRDTMRPERVELLDRAAELGVKVHGNAKIETIRQKVAEAEAAQAE